MAEAELFRLKDEVTCCICLDTLSNPVSILCGHSFCLKCLTEYWDQNQDCRCPQCRRTFTKRPKLHRNTALNRVVRKIKKPRFSLHLFENYKNMACDACIGLKSLAVKFCLTCMASYCQTHLKPHLEIAAWKDHKLTDPDGDLKEQFCEQHEKRLEMFCINDKTCVCVMCVATGHNEHIMVELEMERIDKQKQLEVTMNEIRRRLKEREKILKKTKRAVEHMKISVPNAVDEYEKSFTDLICCIDETQRKLTERIREQVTREVKKAEGVMERLEKDMEEQKKRDADLRELSETKEHNCILQSLSSRRVLPADGDSLSITVALNFSSADLREELSCLKENLEKISQWEVVTWTSGRDTPIFALQPPEPRSRAEFLQYFCPLTLDINTAHRTLHLSEEDKKVTYATRKAKYPNHPDRFRLLSQVLCREALIGTRFYWEVECTGTCIDIGVAYKGLNRKGTYKDCGLGNNDKSWRFCWKHPHRANHVEWQMFLYETPYSPRIGVYLDWPAGSLSFYSILHTMTLVRRIKTSFTEPLYPAFYCCYSLTICQPMPDDH